MSFPKPFLNPKKSLPVLTLAICMDVVRGGTELNTELEVLHFYPFSFKGNLLPPTSVIAAGLRGVRPLN